MKGGLIKCNIINVILLGLIFALFFVTNIYCAGVGLLFWVIWFIYSNYVIAIQSNDICYQLKASDKYNNFTSQINTLQNQYKSVIEREDVFKNLKDDNINRVYDLVLDKIIGSIKSSTNIIKVVGRQDYKGYKDGVDKLISENKDVLEKLNEIVKHTISIDSEINEVDTSYVNDILNSLRSVDNGQGE